MNTLADFFGNGLHLRETLIFIGLIFLVIRLYKAFQHEPSCPLTTNHPRFNFDEINKSETYSLTQYRHPEYCADDDEDEEEEEDPQEEDERIAREEDENSISRNAIIRKGYAQFYVERKTRYSHPPQAFRRLRARLRLKKMRKAHK